MTTSTSCGQCSGNGNHFYLLHQSRILRISASKTLFVVNFRLQPMALVTDADCGLLNKIVRGVFVVLNT